MKNSSQTTNSENSNQYLTCRVQYLDDTDPFQSTNFPEPTRPPSYTFNIDQPLCEQIAGIHRLLKAPHKIGDCTLQLSHTHVYLDLDMSIAEQKEEFENFNADGKRHSMIIRTLLSIRVHSCIEKLYNSKGRELRRALFSLKQVFQEDKDLVHQFVVADGLTCLIKVGAETDQHYQNYILRALGQIMLYIDGMEGVIRHKDTIRWLYSLISSRFVLVMKTALKLLLVFVEYSEANALILLDAIQHVDKIQGQPTWKNYMDVLNEKDSHDTELLVYTMTLINKTLSNVPDQDTFYDVTDALEEQKINQIAQRHTNDKRGSDIDLVEQFKIYELALKHEDGDDGVTDTSVAGTTIKWNRDRRKSDADRKSKRRNSVTGASFGIPLPENVPLEKSPEKIPSINENQTAKRVSDPNASPKPWLQRLGSAPVLYSNHNNYADPVKATGEISEEREKRRRERMAKWSEREKSYRRQLRPSLEDVYQIERDKLERRRNLLNAEKSVLNSNQNGSANGVCNTEEKIEEVQEPPPPPTRTSTSKVLEKRRLERKKQELQEQIQRKLREQEDILENSKNEPVLNGNSQESVTVSRRRRRHELATKPPLPEAETIPVVALSNGETHFPADNVEMQHMRSRMTSEKNQSCTQKIESDFPHNKPKTTDEVITNDQKLFMDMLYANQVVASQQRESDECSEETTSSESPSVLPTQNSTSSTVKALAKRLQNPSALSSDNKFSSNDKKENQTPSTLTTADSLPSAVKKDSDIMWEKLMSQEAHKKLQHIDGFDFSGISELDDYDVIDSLSSAVLPTCGPQATPPPPPPPIMKNVPPPPPCAPPPPPVPRSNNFSSNSNISKRRTIRLFWKEASMPPPNNIRHRSTVWTEMETVDLDPRHFVNLFLLENKESSQKKTQAEKRNELRVLDMKRSNAINIGLTILPPPRTIKSAILNMDEFALTKEQIEKLLSMVPSDDEIAAIQEAMQSSPDVALGSAEQFLLTLSSISELEARLQLWAFKLDYETMEKEVAEPLQDLKDGIAELKNNKTFRNLLATLRSIGNLLNNSNAKGFEITYLSKVPEVKDTVHKKSLLQHLTQLVVEKFPDTTDLYSELGALTRCSRADFGGLEETLACMEERCKNSWDHLKLIAKHESKAAYRTKLSAFLMTCAQKIITLKIVHSRLKNRFHAMLLYFGTSPKTVKENSIQGFARLISEFALDFRTAKERVESQRKKKQQKGTRGKMILEQESFLSDSLLSDDEFSVTLTQNFSTTEEEMKQKIMERVIRPSDEQTERRSRPRSNKSRKSEDLGKMSSSMRNLLAPSTPDDVTDQIMEQIVKTATQTPRDRTTVVNRRKRSRHSERKSLRRTLKNGLTDEERAFILSNC